MQNEKKDRNVCIRFLISIHFPAYSQSDFSITFNMYVSLKHRLVNYVRLTFQATNAPSWSIKY